MKKSVALLALATAGAGFGVSATAVAASAEVDAHLGTTRNEVVRSGTGACWRLGYWAPDHASPECDPSLPPRAAPPIETPPAEPLPLVMTPRPPAPAGPPPTTFSATLPAQALFDFDEAELRPDDRQALDATLSQAEGQPIRRIRIEGHADRIGDPEYNQQLSEARAEAVREYLVTQGFPADAIQATGYGITRPVTDGCPAAQAFNDLVACLQPDRRVEVTVEVEGVQPATGPAFDSTPQPPTS